jgi:outer membrane biosynthesis protein TonB
LAKNQKSKGGAKGSQSKGSESKAPASEGPGEVPGTSSSSTPYLIGIVIFGVGIAALLYARCSEETSAPQEPQANAQPAPKASGSVNADLPEFAPPPPPEEDAGTDAGTDDAGTEEPVKTASTGGKPTAGPAGACAKCGAKGTKAGSALKAAVRGTAGTAHGCYNRALREGGAQGKMTVGVSVGTTGSVCGVSVISDTVGNPSLTSCVLSKFKGRTYPKPESGCVTIGVPLNFTVK